MSDSKQKTQTSEPGESDDSISDLEAAKLLLDAWKFRQAHAWSLLTRYYFSAVFVSSTPYILEKKLIENLDTIVLALPVLGGFLALAAVWLYAAEYIRAQSMNHGFKSILERYGYHEITLLRGWEALILKPKIGWTTIYILTLVSVLLGTVNFLIVWNFFR